MQIPPSEIKILKSEFANQILSKEWLEILMSGDLYKFEQQFYRSITNLYDKICGSFIGIVSSSSEFVEKQRKIAKEKGLKKLVSRPVELQLRTGTKIKYDSLYAKKVPKEYEGSRHTSMLLWPSFSKSSPMYQGVTCLLSVICPSFEVSKNILRYQGIHANFDRIRELSLSLAEAAMEKRSTIQLLPNESLKGKRVVIGMDGGRTRTREYVDESESKRSQKYDTPWREPKLFVITTIDENGKINKRDLPIYDCSFGDDETFELLAEYLKALEIDKAKDVQFIADGAPWIWNRAKEMLVCLGVNEEKIRETLDFYHAMEHVHKLMDYVEKDQKIVILKKLKQALWKGNVSKMRRLILKGIPNVDLEDFTPYKYFVKNKKRLDYQSLREESRPIGSGVVESGIRRVINLRFKSPSSFWYPENVEKLIFMRGIALSGRWEIMMKNLTKLRV
jgi:hypothetical protein